MVKREKAFVGKFSELLDAFVKWKRNLGYDYYTTRESLRQFSIFTLNYDIKNGALDKKLVLDWTEKRKHEMTSTWEHRRNYLRQFALYLQSQGCDVFFPPKIYKIRRNEHVPYIFTKYEIKRFLDVVDSTKPRPHSNGHKNYPLLFRLLYCCGLRISESLHLRISDIDFERGVLFIREAKFDKERLVPLSTSLANLFGRFHALFNRNNFPEDHFFRNEDGSPLSSHWVYHMFRKMLWRAEISHGGKGKGPRLHDLRHTFCVHTLARQVKEGVDLYVALPILSSYIGHGSVCATQRYVRLTVEAHPELIEKVSRTCAYVFPKVTR